MVIATVSTPLPFNQPLLRIALWYPAQWLWILVECRGHGGAKGSKIRGGGGDNLGPDDYIDLIRLMSRIT